MKLKIKEKSSILNRFSDFSFFMFFCAIFGHLTYEGVNNYVVFTAIICVCVSMSLKIIIDLLNNRVKQLIKLHTVWYGIFLVISLLSYNWALNTLYVVSILKPISINLFLSFFLMYYIKTKEDLIRIFKFVIVAAVYLLVISVSTTSFINYKPGMIGSNIGLNHNFIALILAFSAILSIYLYSENKEKKYILIVFIFFVAILITGSRKSTLILIGGSVLFYFLKNKAIKRVFNIIIFIFLGITIYVFIMNNKFLYNVLGERLMILLKSLGGNSNFVDLSILERRYYRETAKILFLQKPLLGWGIHNFAAYMEYISYSHIAYAHNNHLEMLADLGVIGYASYYSMYVYILANSLKGVIKKNKLEILAFIVMLLLIVFEYGFVSYYEPAFQLFIMCMFAIIKIKSMNEDNVKL